MDKKIPVLSCLLVLCASLFLPQPVLAAEHASLPQNLAIYWIIPFVCMLLSIAIAPLTIPHFWEHHFGKVAVFWAAAFLIPCAANFGFSVAVHEFLHAILTDYMPFIILLFSLFTVAGGVRLKGNMVGTPVVNTGILAVGTVLASWMGTTGAAMLLIRPILRANAHRRYRVHSIVFFIFLVANIGGSLSPLGDPPLFLGFLKGVDFFWTTTHLFVKTLLAATILLALFFVLDTILYAKEGKPMPPKESQTCEAIGLEGKINLLLLLGIVFAVLGSGMIKLGTWVSLLGVEIEGQNILRDLTLLLIAALSWKLTDPHSRSEQYGKKRNPTVHPVPHGIDQQKDNPPIQVRDKPRLLKDWHKCRRRKDLSVLVLYPR